jgi:hypothetical protein
MIEHLFYRRSPSYSIVIFCFLSPKTLKALKGSLTSFKNCSKRLRSEGVMALQTLGAGGGWGEGRERGLKLEIKHAQGGPRVVNKCCEL